MFADQLSKDPDTYNVSITLNNDGIGGYTTSNIYDLITSDQKVVNDIKNADVITLLCGANNITYAMLYQLEQSGQISLPWNFDMQGKDVDTFYNISTDVLTNTNNYYHKEMITKTNKDLHNIIDTINQYNNDCIIIIGTIYYDRQFFISLFMQMLDINQTYAEKMADNYYISAKEIQSYFNDVSSEYSNVYLTDTSDEAKDSYFQYDENGKFLDLHPNKEGQEILANCFYREMIK